MYQYKQAAECTSKTFISMEKETKKIESYLNKFRIEKLFPFTENHELAVALNKQKKKEERDGKKTHPRTRNRKILQLSPSANDLMGNSHESTEHKKSKGLLPLFSFPFLL